MATQAEIDTQQQQLVQIRDDIRASRAAGTLSDVQFRRLGQKLLDRNQLVSEMVPTDEFVGPLQQTEVERAQAATETDIERQRLMTELGPGEARQQLGLQEPADPFRAAVRGAARFNIFTEAEAQKIKFMRGALEFALEKATPKQRDIFFRAVQSEDPTKTRKFLKDRIPKVIQELSLPGTFNVRAALDFADQISNAVLTGTLRLPLEIVDPRLAAELPRVTPETLADLDPREREAILRGEELGRGGQALMGSALGGAVAGPFGVVPGAVAGALKAPFIPSRFGGFEQEQIIGGMLGTLPVEAPIGIALEEAIAAAGVARLTSARRSILRVGVVPLEPPAGIIIEVGEELADPLRILVNEAVPVRGVGAKPPPLRRRIPAGAPGAKLKAQIANLPAEAITAPPPIKGIPPDDIALGFKPQRTVRDLVGPNSNPTGAQKLSNAAASAPYKTEKQVIRESRVAAEVALGPGNKQKAIKIADGVATLAEAEREVLKTVATPLLGNRDSSRLATMAKMASSKLEDLVATVEKYVRQEISPEALRIFDQGTNGAGSQVISRVISAENTLRSKLSEIWFTGRRFVDGTRAKGILEIIKPLSEAEAINVFDVITNPAQFKAISPAAGEAARTIQFWNNETINAAISAEVLSKAADGTEAVVRRRANFMPHLLTNKVKETRQLRGALAREIAATNPRVSIREAEKIVEDIRTGERFGKSGSLNFRREISVSDKFLEKDVRKLMPRYYAGAWREISEAQHYGNNFQNMKALIENVDEAFLAGRVGEAEAAGFGRADFETLVNRMALQTGPGFTPGRQTLSRALRGAAVVTSMHKSAISSLATLNNLPVIARGRGFGPAIVDAAGGVVDAWAEARALRAIQKGTAGAKEFDQIASIRAGITPTGGLTDRYHADIIRFASEHGDFDVARGFLRLVQHERNELFVRRATVNTARRHAERLTRHLRSLKPGQDNPYARMILTELIDDTENINAAALEMERIVKAGLTSSDLDRIGANAVRRTQPLSITDIPHHLMTPLGRARGQFKATLLKEFRFVRDTIIKDAQLYVNTGGKQGAIQPLIGWFVTGQALGFTIVELKNALGFGFRTVAGFVTGIPARRRKRPDTALVFLVDNILQVGGVAYALDFMTSVTIDPRTGVLAWAIGPGFGKLSATIGRGAQKGPAGAIEQAVPFDLIPRQRGEIPSQGELLVEGLEPVLQSPLVNPIGAAARAAGVTR